MGNFIKVVVPKEGYREVTQVGDRYMIHLQGVEKDGMMECYECMTSEEPDIEVLSDELDEYIRNMDAKFLARAKANKIAELEAYNKSDAVDSFTINGKTMWLDHDLRQQLRISLDALSQAGRENVTKWFDGEKYAYPIDVWYYMLGQVEVYAADALNVTESHKAAVNALTSLAEVQEYDFTVGYPQKLEF